MIDDECIGKSLMLLLGLYSVNFCIFINIHTADVSDDELNDFDLLT